MWGFFIFGAWFWRWRTLLSPTWHHRLLKFDNKSLRHASESANVNRPWWWKPMLCMLMFFCSIFDMRRSKHTSSRKRTFLLLSFPLPRRILQELSSFSAPKVTALRWNNRWNYYPLPSSKKRGRHTLPYLRTCSDFFGQVSSSCYYKKSSEISPAPLLNEWHTVLISTCTTAMFIFMVCFDHIVPSLDYKMFSQSITTFSFHLLINNKGRVWELS